MDRIKERREEYPKKSTLGTMYTIECSKSTEVIENEERHIPSKGRTFVISRLDGIYSE